MKKLLLTAVALCAIFTSNAQEENDKFEEKEVGEYTYSIHTSFADHMSFGVEAESQGYILKEDGYVHTVDVRISYSTFDYAEQLDRGSGIQVEVGSKTFYTKKQVKAGFYSANFLSYGRYDFEETLYAAGEDYEFDGRYSYFSFLAPEIGYKLMLGDKFSIDPFAGVMWKIEIKGKGDIDNNITDEWVPKFGVKLGYTF